MLKDIKASEVLFALEYAAKELDYATAMCEVLYDKRDEAKKSYQRIFDKAYKSSADFYHAHFVSIDASTKLGKICQEIANFEERIDEALHDYTVIQKAYHQIERTESAVNAANNKSQNNNL